MIYFHILNQCVNVVTSMLVSTMCVVGTPINFICKTLLVTLSADTVVTGMITPSNSKKDSVMYHHLYTIAMILMHLFADNYSSDWNEIVKLLLMYEFSTPIICLHNIAPDIITKQIRNIVWSLTRLPLFFMILTKTFLLIQKNPSLELSYLGTFILNINSFTLAWTTGYEYSSLFLYMSPIFFSLGHKNTNHLYLSVLGLIASFWFYTSKFRPELEYYRIIDQFVVATHCLYYLTSIYNLAPILSISFFAIGNVLSNYYHFNFLQTIPQIFLTLCICDSISLPIDLLSKFILCVSFLIMILIVAVKGGPLYANYADKIVWHTSACTLLSMLITINVTIKN